MKYELTDHTKLVAGHTLYQIRATEDFGWIKKGQLGGWIENRNNLQIDGIPETDPDFNNGNAWIYENACVFGKSVVYGNARVYGDAVVIDTEISGNARVYGAAHITDSFIEGHAIVCGKSDIHDSWIARRISLKDKILSGANLI